MRIFAAVLCLATASSVFAQDPAKAPPLTVCEVRLIPNPTDTPPEKQAEAARQAKRRASLGDSIIIALNPAELTAYLDYAAKQDKPVTLYLNGNDTGIAPEAIDAPGGRLQFHLERNAANKAVWGALLRHPFLYQVRRVKAGVGIAPAPVAIAAEFWLVVVKWAWYAWAWLVLLLLVVILFAWLTAKKGMLRDVAGGPYSLGRCQMAWWFFLIIVAYVMIWLISGDRDTIPVSLLGLMGISAGTALGAVLIESTQAGNAPAAPPHSNGFVRDILGDSQGNIGLHRFQMVLWTIVLGIMFVVGVMAELSMPEFNATLLATMGVSAGTYLGFKFPEK
ncbi:MAG TPA: hypothetical protein VJ276_13735 [Thermoanaerobaculia bacterium]|nr:hypothetical protein [Thermoanaerobaculia bacterium]